MKWFKRISLFLITNILVMATLSIVLTLISTLLGFNKLNNYMGYLLVFSAVWGMGGAFISLLLSKVMAKWMMGVKIIDPKTQDPTERKLLETTYTLARRAGLTEMPEVGIYEAPEINAFATGPSRNNSLVAVSSGLLNSMTSPEVEGVLGHEITHVANGDMVTMTLIQGIVNAFVIFFSRIVAGIIAQNVDEKYQGVVRFMLTIAFDIIFTILGSLVVNYFSRRREFRADAGGARYAGRNQMIAGLKRLKSQVEQIAPDNSGLATLKISSPPSGLLSLFSTHPPLDERIARLEQLKP